MVDSFIPHLREVVNRAIRAHKAPQQQVEKDEVFNHVYVELRDREHRTFNPRRGPFRAWAEDVAARETAAFLRREALLMVA